MCNLHWCYTFCTGATLFALVLHLNCTALSQSESSNFFMYIINKCMGIRTLSEHSLRMPIYISLLILTFINRCISVKTSLIDTKLWGSVNLGVLFLTMWINSCLCHNLQTRT